MPPLHGYAAGRISGAFFPVICTWDVPGEMMKTNCDSCMYYEYDEEYDCCVCNMDLDEDEMARFMQDRFYECPYYRFGDEYTIVRKQM